MATTASPSPLCAPKTQLPQQGAPPATANTGAWQPWCLLLPQCVATTAAPEGYPKGYPRCRGEDVLSLQQQLSPCPSFLCDFSVPGVVLIIYASEHVWHSVVGRRIHSLSVLRTFSSRVRLDFPDVSVSSSNRFSILKAIDSIIITYIFEHIAGSFSI